jgi:hypothetical protein
MMKQVVEGHIGRRKREDKVSEEQIKLRENVSEMRINAEISKRQRMLGIR